MSRLRLWSSHSRLERLLRRSRPEARDAFVRQLAGKVASPARRSRGAVAGRGALRGAILTAAMVGALVAVGAGGFAMSLVEKTVSHVTKQVLLAPKKTTLGNVNVDAAQAQYGTTTTGTTTTATTTTATTTTATTTTAATTTVATTTAAGTTTTVATTTTTAAFAPPPPGVSSSDLGVPATAFVTAGAPTTVTKSADGADATISVPAGALPAGTTVSVFPVVNASSLAASLPTTAAYVVSFSVSWKTPDGTTPNAAKPITITIHDPKILAGDSIYEITAAGLTNVGTATTNGVVTITFSHDPTFLVAAPRPTITITTTKVTAQSGTVGLGIACSKAACSGVAELTESVSTKVKTGKKVTMKKVVVVLAKSSFKLAKSKHETLNLTLTAQGKGAFAHAAVHPVRVNGVVSVSGGKRVTKSIVVS